MGGPRPPYSSSLSQQFMARLPGHIWTSQHDGASARSVNSQRRSGVGARMLINSSCTGLEARESPARTAEVTRRPSKSEPL